MKKILVTNNELVYETYKESKNIVYLENYTYIQLLEWIRDKIHLGHKLYTHPLSGSIKPNETPYKTIIISKEADELDEESLNIIEQSILTSVKFLNNSKVPLWTESILKDFKTIDLSLIQNTLDRIHHI